jgi:hypothetical protein
VDDLRRAVILLAKATGWGLAELLDLDLDDFWAWFDQAEVVENEIVEAIKAP